MIRTVAQWAVYIAALCIGLAIIVHAFLPIVRELL